MPFELVEVRRPELPVGSEPGVQIGERLRADPVEAALRVDARLDEACVLQHAQVLRHRRLGEAEPPDELADRPLAVAEQLEDRDAPGLRQSLQCWQFAHPTEYSKAVICLSRKQQAGPDVRV